MSITADYLDKLIAQTEKQWGKLGVSIHRGSEIEDVYRIPFISPNLNYATHGGLPIGRFSLMWGPESSYKTRCAYESIAQAQDLYDASERALYPRIKLYRDMGEDEIVNRLTEELEYIQGKWPEGMEVALYNVEQQYDKVWAEKVGIDTHRLVLVEGQIIEALVEIMEGSYDRIDMHVVDSTSSAASLEEHTMKMTDYRVGLDARIWKKCIRKSQRFFDHQRNVGVLINQASTNVRTGGTTPVSTRHLRHTSSMTVKFEQGKFLYIQDGLLREDKPEGADRESLAGRVEADGRQIFATVEKSRVCRPFKIAALHAPYGARRFDHTWELMNAAVHFGIATKSGAYYKIDGDESSCHGLKNLYDRIDADEDLQGRVFARLMHSLIEEDLQLLAS